MMSPKVKAVKCVSYIVPSAEPIRVMPVPSTHTCAWGPGKATAGPSHYDVHMGQVVFQLDS